MLPYDPNINPIAAWTDGDESSLNLEHFRTAFLSLNIAFGLILFVFFFEIAKDKREKKGTKTDKSSLLTRCVQNDPGPKWESVGYHY